MTVKTFTGFVFSLFLAGSITSCSATEPLADPTYTQESLSRQLEVGERVIVFTDCGQKYNSWRVVALDESHLICHHDKYGKVSIPYTSIEIIHTEHPEAGNTFAIILGGSAALIIASGAMATAFGN